MKILVINPNSTSSMTELIGTEARQAATADTVIVAVNPSEGPPAIQGALDGENALPHLIALFDRKLGEDQFDAEIVACFDDTGLWELKKRSTIPVVGIGEAAFHAAMLLGERFTVVTTLGVAVPVIKQNIVQQGIMSRCAAVRASEIPVLELEADPHSSRKRIAAEISEALQSEQCDAVVLGCAGMADIASSLQQDFSIPVIDGVKAAVGLCEMLYRLEPQVPSGSSTGPTPSVGPVSG